MPDYPQPGATTVVGSPDSGEIGGLSRLHGGEKPTTKFSQGPDDQLPASPSPSDMSAIRRYNHAIDATNGRITRNQRAIKALKGGIDV